MARDGASVPTARMLLQENEKCASVIRKTRAARPLVLLHALEDARMKTRRIASLAALALLAALVSLPVSPAGAGAAWLTESGGADMGLAGAGRTALALDAAALAANPASLAGLPGSHLTIAATPVRLDFEFEGDATSPGQARNRAGATPAGSLYASWATGPVTLGFGAYTYAGLGLDYSDGWVGRYVVEDASLETLNLAFALGWRAGERLDLGASVFAQRTAVSGALAISNSPAWYGPPADLPDGRVSLDGTNWSPGGSVGLRYRITDTTRLGLAWTSPVEQDVTLDVRARDLHPLLETMLPAHSDGHLDTMVPQQVSVGLTRQWGRATTIAAGANWQDWSQFGDAQLRILGRSVRMFPEGLRDTWGASVGLRHSFSKGWAISTGIAYDSSPARGTTVPAYFPVAEQWRASLGLERQVNRDLDLRVALSLIDQGDARIDHPVSPWPVPGPGVSGRIGSSRALVLAVASDFAL